MTIAEGLVAIGGSPAVSLVVKASAIIALALAGVSLARTVRAAVRHALLASALPAASVFIPPVDLRVPVPAVVARPPVAIVQTSDRIVQERASATRAARPSTTDRRPAPAVNPLVAVWAAGALLYVVPVALGVYRIRGVRVRGRAWQR